jgi:GcrA cell cycle regulator
MRDDPTTDDGFCGISALLAPAEMPPVPAGATAAVRHDRAAADRAAWARGSPPWPAERTAELLRLRERGLSGGQIARELGTTRNAVIGKLHRLGLTIVVTRVTSEEHRQKRREQKARLRERQRVQRLVLAAPKKRCADVPSAHLFSQKHNMPAKLAKLGKVPIWGLTAHSCRWPLFAGDEPFHRKFYCGDKAVRGAPYCGEHLRVSYGGNRSCR